MPKFLIEVEHEAEIVACAKAVKVLLATGSHWITHADWGCVDGVHKGWIIVDVASKDEARQIVPPAYRGHANVIQLNTFSVAEMDELLRQHGG